MPAIADLQEIRRQLNMLNTNGKIGKFGIWSDPFK